VTLLILFGILAFVFITLLLGGSVLIQSWLYNVPANNIVVRAVASGTALAAFYTLWAAMDSASPGKYDSVFEGADLKIEDYDHIVSVKKSKSKEEEIPYRKNATGAKVQFFKENEYQKGWSRSDADGMMTAILIQEKDKTEKTRFEIKLVDGKLPNDTTYFEKGGRRYIDAPQLGRIVTPRGGSFMLRAFISMLHLALLVVALWLGMNFVFGHALGMGFGIWTIMTFAFLPVLFYNIREKQAPPPTATPPAKVQMKSHQLSAVSHQPEAVFALLTADS
jgi:hypothetical protein